MTVLLLSGGLDSLVLLARECAAGRRPLCVSFNYGQRHSHPESNAACEIARHYGTELVTFVLPRLSGSALTGDGGIPKGLHFEDPGQAATVVPNRNMVMLSVAASLGARARWPVVLFAAHKGDAAVYPDCRAGFVRAMNDALALSCGVRVEAPFLDMSKREVVRLGRSLGAPLELSWSCYDPQSRPWDGAPTERPMVRHVPCDRCGACVERLEAMA
jgi:7-cyano-7-deazaguanine synthase